MSEKLAALSPELTAMGKKIRQDLTPDPANKNFIAGLPVEFHNNLVASTLKIEDLIKPRKGERITSALHRVITEGVEQPDGSMKLFQPAEIRKILKEHNLTVDQFGLVFLMGPLLIACIKCFTIEKTRQTQLIFLLLQIALISSASSLFIIRFS